MHVGLITYQTGHLKTWDVGRHLLDNLHQVTLFAFPFAFRPPKIGPKRYQDRPWQLLDSWFNVRDFAYHCGFNLVEMGGWTEEFESQFTGPDIYLHCTAKIIPASFIAGRTILNCHPGLLPQNRGVDAFKWSIINKQPIGVTLHAIDAEIDRGFILKRMPVPVFPTDELADVCQRMYDFEIDLLGNFEHHLDGERVPVGDEYPCSHVKIPIDQDQRLAEIFRENRAELCRLSNSFNRDA